MDDRIPAGFTLIELLITIAVLGIALGIAVPAMKQFIERNRLVSAAEHLAADLHFARSEAIKSSRHGIVHISFRKSGKLWCYGLAHHARCDCFAGQLPGQGKCAFKSGQSQDFPGIALAEVRFSGTSNTLFESTRGTAKAGHVEFRTATGHSLQVRVSTPGRVRICASESGKMPGRYSPC